MPGQKCVHTKVGKEKHWTGKTHSNDSALQVGRPRVNLLNLKESFGIAVATRRSAIGSIWADSIGTNKVTSIRCCGWWHPGGCTTGGRKGGFCGDCESTLLVQLQ